MILFVLPCLFLQIILFTIVIIALKTVIVGVGETS
nr:MAG TPA: hypothetical protein [Caudoviricetes sp.]